VNVEQARRVFAEMPVVRVATVGADGAPHVVPLWFTWQPEAVYVSIRGGSITLENVRRDPRVALLFDAGRTWIELAGAVVHGKAEALEPSHPDLRRPLSRWHDKYRLQLAGGGFRRFTESIQELWFLRVVPERITSWDHASG
jgi:PPOX class probable F420-dependent enzyme